MKTEVSQRVNGQQEKTEKLGVTGLNGRHNGVVADPNLMEKQLFGDRSERLTTTHPAARTLLKKKLIDRIETFISKLTLKNHFWYRFFSWIWLPFAFRSGLRVNHNENCFTAVLPFRRFNRNWYSAMSGAVLLANSEIAGGMCVFKECGGKFRVVCKNLEYRFLQPCIGPAFYRMTPRQNIRELVATGNEFNVELDIAIVQVMRTPQERERRVGRCVATFHASPIPSKRKRRYLQKIPKIFKSSSKV